VGAVHVRCPGCCLSSPVSVRIALKMVPASASPVLLLDQAPEAARRGDCCPLLRSPLDTCSQGEQDKKILLRQPRIAHTQQPPNKLAAHWCWLSIDTEHCSLHPHPCWYVQLSMAFGTSKPSGPAGDKKRKATHTFCCMRLAGSPASWHDLCVGQVKHRTRSTAQRSTAQHSTAQHSAPLSVVHRSAACVTWYWCCFRYCPRPARKESCRGIATGNRHTDRTS